MQLEDKINQPGLLKKNKQIIGNINKEDVLKKINDLKNQNEQTEKKIQEIENWKNQEIF